MRVNLQEFNTKQTEPDTKFYTVNGSQDFYDDDGAPRLNTENTKVFAKAIKNKQSKHMNSTTYGYRFYIRTDPNKNIVDPVQLYTIEKPKASFIDKICKTESDFREVSESIFNKYINYLKTKSTQWLISAQREIR
jgi:hypothetical protein